MHQPHPTIEEVLATLRSKPGIDVARLPNGTQIIVETAQYLYEMLVISNETFVLEIGGTDPRFHIRRPGVLRRSIYDVDGKVFLPHWISKDLRMQFILNSNTSIFSAKTLSARVEGSDWYFDVF